MDLNNCINNPSYQYPDYFTNYNTSNNFHINAKTELALTYNDSSVLENFHCSKLFNILKKDETNIFDVLSINEFKDIRKRMISEILATDMFYHKQVMSMIQTKMPQIKSDKFE